MPPASCTNKDFLREVLAGQKKLFKLAEVKWINPPKYDEISVANLYPKFKDDAKVAVYLPTKLAKGKLPDRAYFFNVLNTVHPNHVKKMVDYANEQRYKSGT